MLYIVNCPLITTEGNFSFHKIDRIEAQELVAKSEWISAIGHLSTAKIVSTLLGVEVKENRITIEQGVNDSLLVFKLDSRPPEGVILTLQELQDLGFTWGVIERYL